MAVKKILIVSASKGAHISETENIIKALSAEGKIECVIVTPEQISQEYADKFDLVINDFEPIKITARHHEHLTGSIGDKIHFYEKPKKMHPKHQKQNKYRFK